MKRTEFNTCIDYFWDGFEAVFKLFFGVTTA